MDGRGNSIESAQKWRVCSVTRMRMLGCLFPVGFLRVLGGKGGKSGEARRWTRLVPRERTLSYRDKNKGSHRNFHFWYEKRYLEYLDIFTVMV